MPRVSKGLLAINFLTLAVVLSAALNAYLIRSDGGGYGPWNAKEACFFIYEDTLGRHVKWIGYPLAAVGEMFGYILPLDDSRGTLFVLRVTSEGVQRHVLDLKDYRQVGAPSMFTPLEGRIWASCPALGGLCWWAGDHFERANQEELRRLGERASLNNDSYDDENGWSKHGLAGSNLDITLGDGTDLLVDGGDETGANLS